jgi:acetolactate synthase-1/2/3 large subunit
LTVDFNFSVGDRDKGGERMATAATKFTCAALIAGILEAYGADHVFGVPGGHCLPLYDALLRAERGPRLISARHEQGAGFMALGYALAARKPGIVLTTAGPGVTNVLTPVGQAQCESIPLIVLAMNNYTAQLDRRLGLFHEMDDYAGLFSGRSAGHFRALEPSDLSYALGQAFNHHRTRRPGPYVLEIPSDLLGRDACGVRWSPWHASPSTPAPAVLDQAARSLVAARQPILLVGGGASSSDAGAEVQMMAEAIGAPVVTTVNARGLLPDSHPLAAGCAWDRIRSDDRLARDADLVFAIGTGLSALSTRSGALPLPETLIQLDIESGAFGRHYVPSLALVGDAKTTLPLLVQRVAELLDAGGRDVVAARRDGEERAQRSRQQRESDLARCAPTVAEFLNTVTPALPDNGLIVCDMAIPGYWAQRYLRVCSTGRLLSTYAFGALGLGLPLAVGAKAARPKQPVILFSGDGGFLYNSQEMATARQSGLDVVVVVFNDGGYSAVRADYRRIGGLERGEFDLQNPDFVTLAKSYGWAAETVNVAELGPTLRRAHQSTTTPVGGILIEVKLAHPLPMPNDVVWDTIAS